MLLTLSLGLINFCSPECERLAASLLLVGPVGCGKSTVVRAMCRLLNIHCYIVNCYNLLADTSAATEAKINNAFFKGKDGVIKSYNNVSLRDHIVAFKGTSKHY